MENDLQVIGDTSSSRRYSTSYHPQLSFRYAVEFLNFPEFKNVYFTTLEVKLPTLQKGSSGGENLWSAHPMTIKFYKFNSPQSIENGLISLFQKNENLELKVNYLEPDSKTVNGYWHIVGEIYKCDFGTISWACDDAVLATLSIVPLECNYVNLIKE